MAPFLLACTCSEIEQRSSTSTTWRGHPQVRQQLAPSCIDSLRSCGASGKDDCCKSLLVPGGTFSRSYDGVDYLDPKSAATLSAFYLDQYEVTVARFRAFVDAGFGTADKPPAAGVGAHPKVHHSGWNPEWNAKLAANPIALRKDLHCYVHQTFTDKPGENESLPVNCLSWYSAFAFCAWDGGRLPTEAEWNYAASGGDEHRYYPWSVPAPSTAIDDTYAVYCGRTCRYERVGSRSPKGDGRWGQSDLGGNVWEWTLDWDPVVYPVPCTDCAEVTKGEYRAFRSGSSDDIAPTLRSATRHVYYPSQRGNIGVRCARNP